MTVHWTEKQRLLDVQTPLGDDVLLRSFTGYEAISHLFRFSLDLLSENTAADFDRMVGQNVTFAVRLADLTKLRYFNGYVSRFSQLPSEERLTHYQAEIVPWLWFLTRTQDCRIFQFKSVPDIIEQIFKDYGFTDYDRQLSGSYQPRDYCVQYRESAFNFVSRLMEEEGIFYFFKHENGKHTLVMADAPTAHKNCPDFYKVLYERTRGKGTGREEDVVLGWRLEQELRTGACALGDYNFETPATRLEATVPSQINQGGNSRFEIFDYPGEYLKRAEGDALAKVRMEEEESVHTVISGESDCRTFVSGFKFELQAYERRDQNQEYVLTSVTHAAEEAGFYTGHGSSTAATYRNGFTAIPAKVKFRPPRTATEPRIAGAQTAVVVGPSGEEIYTDKYGRVKVQFHWDRRSQANEKSSCWIRVSQPWAGKGWGAMWIPRIGQEVIVDFLEGDPDRPIITGRVYNALQMPPYGLPDEMTKSTFKSYSSKGGGGFNELRFEDKKGSEQILLFGQRNIDVRSKNDLFETVVNERHHVVIKDELTHLKADSHLKIDGDRNEKVGGTESLKTGQDLEVKVGNNYALDAGTEIHLKAGMNLVIESGTTLTLKVGGNFVNINSGGVFIKGSMVMINSGGAAGSGAGANPTAPKEAKEADTAQPGQASQPPPKPQPPQSHSYSATAAVLRDAAASGAPFCDI